MYEPWIGKEMIRTDGLAIETVQRYEALMDRDPFAVKHDDALDPGLHWLFFTPIDQQYTLDRNGHVKKGDFFPPVPLPKRMLAGGKIRFDEVVMLGEITERTSVIKSVEEKQGGTGELCFVTVNHQLQQNDEVAIDEDQLIVYTGNGEHGRLPVRTEALDIAPEWKHGYTTDSVILFRFSALTYNAHRIHYDEPYAREAEGYPSLVVQGPFLMLLLLEKFAKEHPWRTITEAGYRAVGPMYNGETITLAGQDTGINTTSCRACGPDGKIAMKAEISWK
ncbi:MAG: MaoC family dehydratase N-terminal domain-containing protein [Balneolales bacterium]